MNDSTLAPRSGGRILIDALVAHGTDTVFSVPGESFLAALDALYEVREKIQLVTCRQEGGAAHMAEAYGKLTGKPGVCFVTRGPGSTNASIGVHTASQDATPLILFVGQVARDSVGREAWQEIDYRHMFGHIAKWVAQIESAERIPEMMHRAFHVAQSGRPGPVILALPEDMLEDLVSVADCPPSRPSMAAPQPEDMVTLQQALARAQRPLLVVGGGGWTPEASRNLTAFATQQQLPVVAGFRRQDLMDNLHENYAGEAGLGMNPRLAQRISDADLILAVGARLGENTTRGYTLLGLPEVQGKTLIHVHPDPNEGGHVYRADLAICTSMPAFASAAAALTPAPENAGRQAWLHAARQDYIDSLVPTTMPGPVDLGEVMRVLRETIAPDSIISNGAGNYTLWVQRFYPYRGMRTQLAPTSGTMGYGLPAAIAAKIVHPDRTAVCFAGDGCFLMSGQELATAVQHGANVLVIVVNNGIYGSIRMHQERHYPGHAHGTDLTNPDFALLAQAYGAHGEVVTETTQFAGALQRALASNKPALIELRTSPEKLTPGWPAAQ